MSFCQGSSTFDPALRLADLSALASAVETLQTKDDFQAAIAEYFQLDAHGGDDEYVYHAMGATQLARVQRVIGLGGKNGLHDWYRDDEGVPLPPPPAADTAAYISIFDPSTSTPSALKGFLSNAKKVSIRLSVAQHLLAKRYLHPALEKKLSVPKVKTTTTTPPPNPYFEFWAWSCRNLEWTGPAPLSASSTKHQQQSHHILPILMHHFGCATPSHEALTILTLLADGRPILDVGSGNGYWSFLLASYYQLHHAQKSKEKKANNTTTSAPAPNPSADPYLPIQKGHIIPIDNAQSEWRTSYLPHNTTIRTTGSAYLSSSSYKGCPDAVLLMVYPIVGTGAGSGGGGGGGGGGGDGTFTRDLMHLYKGDTVAVVGTQNGNGYTSFRDMTFDEYMAREQAQNGWVKVVQIPLPSFAGKDEALFVYQRGERAPTATV